MEIQALFFKNRQEFKYYATEKINIPDGIIYTNEGGNRFLKVRKYIKNNRKNFGYEEMVMVLPASEEDVDIIGCPMMIAPLVADGEDNIIPMDTAEEYKDLFSNLQEEFESNLRYF